MMAAVCQHTSRAVKKYSLFLSLSLISYSDQQGINHHKRCCQVLNSREKLRANANQCSTPSIPYSLALHQSLSTREQMPKVFPQSNDVTAGKHRGTFQVKHIMNLTPFTVLIHILDLIKRKKKWLAIITFIQNKKKLFSPFAFGCSLEVSRQSGEIFCKAASKQHGL